MSFDDTYIDPDLQRLHIRNSADHEPGAYLVPGDPHGWAVPAHRLAEFVGLLYQAAGQPVPDLPDIPDPAEVEALARELQNAHHCAEATFTDQARWLLTHGYGRTASDAP